MSKYHDDKYDEIKSLISKSRYLNEQIQRDNIAQSIEDRIQQDTGYETADSEDGEEKETRTLS